MELLYASCVGLIVRVYLILRAHFSSGARAYHSPVNLFCSPQGVYKSIGAGVGSVCRVCRSALSVSIDRHSDWFCDDRVCAILAIRGRTDLGNDHVDGQPRSKKGS